MTRAAKYPLVTLGILAALAPILYFRAITEALRSHGREDRIIFGGKRIQQAINEYVEKHGAPPKTLDELTPTFIDSIPTFPDISRVDYHVAQGGKEWTLDLYRSNRNLPLIYRRTNAQLGSEDAERRVQTEDGCFVLRAR